jgi:hypothetical protein
MKSHSTVIMKPIIAVIGGRRTGALLKEAEDVGRLIARRGCSFAADSAGHGYHGAKSKAA